MSDSNKEINHIVQSRLLLGRQQIFTDVSEITSENITKVMGDAYQKHLKNRNEIEYLYNYYRGKQAVLERSKANHTEICAKITENTAAEIVDFWTGWLCGEPIQYVSVSGDNSEAAAKLNLLCNGVSKSAVDKEIVNWAMICGVGYRYIDAGTKKQYSLDPRQTFIVRRNNYTKDPIAAVVYSTSDDGTNHYDVYTKDMYYSMTGTTEPVVDKSQPLALGSLPIIEYDANVTRQGSFERALPLLDAINELQSNRLDGVAQQIQGLLVLTNADIPDGTSADEVRRLGIIRLISTDGNKADINEIVTKLDQTAMQTFKKDLYEAALRISGVPATGNANTGDSSNNGAVILKNGWQGAEARAKDFELLFKRSDKESLAVLKRIYSVNDIVDFDVADIDPHFTRRQYEDINAKSQVLLNLLNTKFVSPRLAFAVCGLFTDPEAAYKESEAWASAQAKEETTNAVNAV